MRRLWMQYLWRLPWLLGYCISSFAAEDPKLCLLLMVRDEEANLRLNLPLWRDIIDCIVVGVDDRTTDDSIGTIEAVLPKDLPRWIFPFHFDGFGHARNLVLEAAWQHFPPPLATHILIGDPDWVPRLETIDKTVLDDHHDTFTVTIWDRSGYTTRLSQWLLLHVEGIRFKYRLHEMLQHPSSGAASSISLASGWEVDEMEGDYSWHTSIHHHSTSAGRYEFDLQLLYQDYEDDPDDLHTLLYLGITSFALIEARLGQGTHEVSSDIMQLVTDSIAHFERAIELFGSGPKGTEMGWACYRWLAHVYHYLRKDPLKAAQTYERCIDYDPGRADCVIFYSRLLSEQGRVDDAWRLAYEALLTVYSERSFADFFYAYECFLPMQAAKLIIEQVASDGGPLGGETLNLVTLGLALCQHQRQHCKQGPIVDSQEEWTAIEDRLMALFRVHSDGERLDAVLEKARASPNETVLQLLLFKWGQGATARSFPAGLVADLEGSANGGQDEL